MMINDSDIRQNSQSLSRQIPCVKCSDIGGDFFRLENTQSTGYCRQCFAGVIRHKFAFCLGKNRVFKEERQREALLIFDPDNFASTQLLELIREAIIEPNIHKRLRLNVRVLILLSNCSTLSNRSTGNLVRNSEQFQCLISKFPADWKWHFTHDSQIFANEIGVNESDQTNEESEKMRFEYNLLLDSCGSESIRSELVQLLRTKLIRRWANHLGCSTVLVPDNADKLARDILAGLCFGRGPSLYDLASMVDRRFEPIQFVRPFRDISDRELAAFYEFSPDKAHLNGEIKTDDNMNTTTIASLQLLTSQFIDSLRANGFPATVSMTVSTILSVAAKVENETNDRPKCSLCYCSFEEPNENYFCESIAKELCQACRGLLNELDARCRNMFIQIIFNT